MPSMLFIGEGDTDEFNFLKNVLDKSLSNSDYEYYSFGTLIYNLYERLTEDDFGDIILTLLETETNHVKKVELERLSKIAFTNIYLIFDFDPHNIKYTPEKIKEMDDYFNDSTDVGKLYINYPMLESFKHIKSKDDYEFFDRSCSLDFLKNSPEKGKAYKKLVSKESGFKNPAWYSDEDIQYIVNLHLTKAYMISNNVSIEVIDSIIYKEITSTAILNKQIKQLEEDKIIPVLNTSLFIAIDHNETAFFANKYINIKEHFEKLELNT